MIQAILAWNRRRKWRKQNARWLADVIAGRHVHTDACRDGGRLVPRCLQVQLLNNVSVLSVKRPLTTEQVANVRVSWRRLWP